MPVTPSMGWYANAKNIVAHGRKRKPTSPTQNELKAMDSRSVNRNSRNRTRRGEKKAARTRRQPTTDLQLRLSQHHDDLGVGGRIAPAPLLGTDLDNMDTPEKKPGVH
jgi:hypothetical protein